MPREITLEQQIAYLLRNPITKPEEMPTPLTTIPMDEEWKNTISKRFWYHKNGIDEYIAENGNVHVPMVKKLFELRDRLLKFGGEEVCLPAYDEDVFKIMERGQLWYGDRIHMMKGKPSQCHRNSSYCWEANQDKAVLCTGYALSEDGMWRQHSWLVELRPRRNKIVETTVPRIAYFGFGMTTEEARDFYFDNE
ncbi:MAG: hypothetical protein IJZ68_09245 [Bacteroidaceae bacterium]|nr:hypothetical protein [Bacteroidaceae bacterium]